MYNIGLGRVIEYGRVTRSIQALDWRKCNGIIIPGQSGSGKTNTAIHYMSQYAAQGVKLIVCDYNGGLEQTLYDQIDHLDDALLWPPVVESEEIVEYIDRIHELGQKRLQKRDMNQFPILFVVDEFSSFISNTPPPNEVTVTRSGDTKITTRKAQYMQRFVDALTTTRKVDIRFMVMGQNWIQAGTTSSLRQFRDNFNTIVFHKLSHTDAKLFTTDIKVIKQIEALKPGLVIHDGTLLKVPLVSSADKYWTMSEVKKYAPRVEADELLEQLLATSCEQVHITTPKIVKLDLEQQKAVEVVEATADTGAFSGKIAAKSTATTTTSKLPSWCYALAPPLPEIMERIHDGETDYSIIKNIYNITGGGRYIKIKAGLVKIRSRMKNAGSK